MGQNEEQKVPPRTKSKADAFFRWLLMLAVAVGLVWWFIVPNSKPSAQAEADLKEIKLQRYAKEAVLSKLKDPGSAEFRNQTGLCGEVNSKNGFGGYVGFKRFVVSADHVVVMDDMLPASDFSTLWTKICK